METDSLTAAGQELRAAITEVIDHAVDYRDSETSEDSCDWAKSQSYAVVLASLQQYIKAQLNYDILLIEKVRAH